MCGRFTDMYTWEQLWRLYMLSVGFPQPNYNHCPTDPRSTILLRFDITVISRYFPEFERELPRYLSQS